jgi:cytochrome c5
VVLRGRTSKHLKVLIRTLTIEYLSREVESSSNRIPLLLFFRVTDMHNIRLLVCMIGIVVGSCPLLVYASDTVRGEAIYNTTCLVCHGSDGAGDMPGVADLTRKGGGLNLEDTILLSRMLNGYQSSGSSMAMPPRGGDSSLTESDLKDVLKFMRGKFQFSR